RAKRSRRQRRWRRRSTARLRRARWRGTWARWRWRASRSRARALGRGRRALKVHADRKLTWLLSQAQNFPEVFQIQTEFMQTQMNRFAEQARSLGEAYNKAATDATKPYHMST